MASIGRIAEEVLQWRALLDNIFAPEVLEQLQLMRPGAAGVGGGSRQLLAHEFFACSFLFAKVDGLKRLADD